MQVHLDQKALAAGLLTSTRILGICGGALVSSGKLDERCRAFCQIRESFSELPQGVSKLCRLLQRV